jgi:hypothetical protein
MPRMKAAVRGQAASLRLVVDREVIFLQVALLYIKNPE